MRKNNQIKPIPGSKKYNRRAILTGGMAIAGVGMIGTAFSGTEKSGENINRGGVFNVLDFNASGKREDNATMPVRNAVEACSEAGGGMVYVPPGDYTVGTIPLKNNVTLHLEAGATFFLSQDRNDFIRGANAMIYAENATNISLTGKGTLNGLAVHELKEMENVDPYIAEEIEIARQAGVDMRRYYRSGNSMQSFICILNDCTNVLIKDVSLIDSPLWTVRLNDCNRVHIRGIYISSDLEKGVNADGIDICSSRNVTISDSVIVSADDSIVIKTTIQRGRERANPSENIVVTNCVLTSSSTALKIGTETYADIRHVIFSNCVVRNSNVGLGIVVQDGATVSDVIFSNITVEGNRRHWNWWGSAELCRIDLKKRNASSKLGKIENVVIDGIMAHIRGTSTIKGHRDQNLKNITLRNVQIFMNPEDAPDKRTTHALKISGVDELYIKDIEVRWNENQTEKKWQSALVLENVNEFEIRHFSGRQGLTGSNEPAILIHNSSDGIITGCRAVNDTQTFIHFSGDQCKDIVLNNNFLKKSKKDLSFETEQLRQQISTGTM